MTGSRANPDQACRWADLRCRRDLLHEPTSEVTNQIRRAVPLAASSHRVASLCSELVTKTIPRRQQVNELPISRHCLTRDPGLVIPGLERPNLSDVADRAAIHTARAIHPDPRITWYTDISYSGRSGR